MLIAIEGCAHGELDNIYESITSIEEEKKTKIDLLICCGDFQAVRNVNDLTCMAIPSKYYNMRSFYKYYNGEKKAPVLTIVVGGNHEASNYLQELPFGGWLAPNIYYLGYAGVVNYGGLKIGGISGIFKGHDYMRGHFECIPYSEGTKRSVYHIRNIEVFRLKQISEDLDIFISHDWPANITQYGNEYGLLRKKPFFRDDIESGRLGSPPCKEILDHLKPSYWFAAHLHCKFSALIKHDEKTTKFLALDKCLPKRHFLQLLEIPHKDDDPLELSYDLEWLTILYLTNHLFSTKSTLQYMPSNLSNERWDFTPTAEELEETSAKFSNDFKIPDNFCKTAKGYDGSESVDNAVIPTSYANDQTIEFCQKLDIDNPAESEHQYFEHESDANLSASMIISETSLNDSSICADTSLTSLPQRSLNLPGPLNDESSQTCQSDDSVIVESEEIIVRKRKSLVLPEPVNECEPKEIPLEKSSILSDDSVVVEKEQPGKKFKRRNASIYQNDDD